MAHSALLESLWPLLGLRISVPGRSLELRIPDDDDLAELVTLAARGTTTSDTYSLVSDGQPFPTRSNSMSTVSNPVANCWGWRSVEFKNVRLRGTFVRVL